jgi:glycosyltransferase involved in cell wall biosynthesis
MPVFNAEPWLRETLASIFCQTLPNFELIAVDDASSDGSYEILQSAAAGDHRIQVLRSPEKGIVAALNYGVSQSRGLYIARMDADDLMPPERLELQADFLECHSDVAVVTGHVAYLGDAEKNAGYARYVDWLNTIQSSADFVCRQFIESPVAHPSVMVRREVMLANPYRHGDFPEDYDLWLRLLAQGLRFSSVPAPVLQWRDHGARASRTDSRYDIEKFYTHKASYLAAWLGARGYTSVAVWSGGRRTRRRIDALSAQGIRIDRFIDVHPRRVGQVIQGVRVVSPDEMFAGPKAVRGRLRVVARGARSHQ